MLGCHGSAGEDSWTVFPMKLKTPRFFETSGTAHPKPFHIPGVLNTRFFTCVSVISQRCQLPRWYSVDDRRWNEYGALDIWYTDRGKHRYSNKNLFKWYNVNYKYQLNWPGIKSRPPSCEAAQCTVEQRCFVSENTEIQAVYETSL